MALILNNVRITNMTGAAISARNNSDVAIQADNLVIDNCAVGIDVSNGTGDLCKDVAAIDLEGDSAGLTESEAPSLKKTPLWKQLLGGVATNVIANLITRAGGMS